MIYEQLKDYCDCVEVNEKDVNELVHLISAYTCWANRPCETFLKTDRTEVVEIPQCLCDCETIRFTPHYTPFEVDTFTFTLVKIDGIEQTLYPITEYSYSEALDQFLIAPDLPKCGCNEANCKCRPIYKLIVTYVAGYEELPECLLPIFCDALKNIAEKNSCGCDECQSCGDEEITAVDYTFARHFRDRVKGYWMDVLQKQYMRELSLISICDRSGDLWGFVV